jgi:undecaprenyl-diphosphatase
VTELDAHLFRVLFGAFSSSEWIGAMAALTLVGGGWGALAIVPLFASTRTRSFASSLAGVLLTTATLVFVLKQLVGRHRPCSCLEGITARVFAAPQDFSFPSGHAAGSFAFALFVGVVVTRAPSAGPARWFVAPALSVLASGVALSRIVLGVHFPVDVLGGAIIGACIGTIGAFLHVRKPAHAPDHPCPDGSKASRADFVRSIARALTGRL